MCTCCCDCSELEDRPDQNEVELKNANKKLEDLVYELTHELEHQLFFLLNQYDDLHEREKELTSKLDKLYRSETKLKEQLEISESKWTKKPIKKQLESIQDSILKTYRLKWKCEAEIRQYVKLIMECLSDIIQCKKDIGDCKVVIQMLNDIIDTIEEELDDCYSSLTNCAACGEEFVDKEECGRECAGCGRWYCINCFDESIESAELAAGEAF